MSAQNLLPDHTIIVTGAATGIGQAFALGAAAQGAHVVVADMHAADETLDLIARAGGRATYARVDVSDETSVQAMAETALQATGRIDGLVNNAAIITTGDIRSTDAASFNRTLAVNTLAPLQLIQAALPHLAATRGSVLNIGSVNAYCGEPNLLPYSISKGGLMTLTRNLGDVLFREEGVRVNQINPGWVLTENEMLRKRSHGLDDDWPASLPKEFCPAGRLIKPEEIAAAAVYWLADECGPMSGQVVDLEQHPFIGRNPPKNILTVPAPPRS
jgi:NAD(P)-dependent dehydrogenase (short-subunit alcohol dehydrogenase family)